MTIRKVEEENDGALYRVRAGLNESPKELNGGVEWYVEGENFVIAHLGYQGGGVGYNEYAKKVSRLKGIFKDDFLNMKRTIP